MSLQNNRSFQVFIVAISFALFTAVFTISFPRYGSIIAGLAILPISIGSWYRGLRGGALIALLSIFVVILAQMTTGYSISSVFSSPNAIIGSFVLVFFGLAFGRIAEIMQEKRDAVINLAHSNKLTYSLLHITTQIENVPSPEEITQSLSRELEKIGIAHAIALYDKKRGVFTFNNTSIEEGHWRILENHAVRPLSEQTFTLDHLGVQPSETTHLHPRMVGDPEVELRAVFSDHNRADLHNFLKTIGVDNKTFVFRLPLTLEENLLGILWVWGSVILISDLPVMSIFAKQVSISLERARLFQEVQELALTDPLTSLPNRRSFFTLGYMEFTRAVRLDRPFCCLMLDLDDFKNVNDTYGHQVGDVVLQNFAQVCRENIRAIDLIGRYGGEEIIILLPETEMDVAVQIAERLRASVAENQTGVNGHTIRVTVSIGVATKDENTLELETLIARADQAMYMAKHKGRNRVAVSH